MPRVTGRSITEVSARASGRASGTHGPLHDIYKVFIFITRSTQTIYSTHQQKLKKVHYASTANSQYKRYCLLNI